MVAAEGPPVTQLAFGLDGIEPTPASPVKGGRPRCKLCGGSFARARVAKQRATAPDRDYAGEWATLVETKPDVRDAVVRAARVVAQRPRPTMDGVWTLASDELCHALDHNLRAPAARWLMATFPDLVGVFRTRETPGNPERAR